MEIYSIKFGLDERLPQDIREELVNSVIEFLNENGFSPFNTSIIRSTK